MTDAGTQNVRSQDAPGLEVLADPGLDGLGLLDRAEAVARAAHRGQTDKAGKPYAEHPRRVSEHARRVSAERGLAEDEAELAVAAAWLHDVVEDTAVTGPMLREHFPERVVEAVLAVSHRDEEAVEDYFSRIRAVPLAVVVKTADLRDNTDPARTALLDGPTRDRLAAKYARARQLLEA